METIGHIQSCLQNRKLNQYYGGTGKYLARSHDVRTERNEVRVSWSRAKSISSSVAQKQILIPYPISDRARLVVIELDYQTSFAYRAGMVIECDKSISSSVAQIQILIHIMNK